jgi:hypothetical protein
MGSLPDRHRRFGAGRRDQGAEMAGHRRHARGFEDFGIVFEQAVQRVARVHHLQRHIELTFLLGHAERFDAQPAPGKIAGRLVRRGVDAEERALLAALMHHHHGLEDRRTAEVAAGLQLLHQQGEGIILVLHRGEHVGANPGQEVGKARIGRKIGAQDDGIDQMPDHAGETRHGATGNRGADQYVGLVAGAVQQQLERRRQKHVQGRAVGLGHLPDAAHLRSLKTEALARAA